MIHNCGQPAGAVLLYEPRSSEDCGAFGSLPDDLIVAIGAQLGAPDLARLALLSRRFGLGQLTTEADEDENEQDYPIGPLPSRFRWCGIASAGAELRISGPKLPASG